MGDITRSITPEDASRLPGGAPARAGLAWIGVVTGLLCLIPPSSGQAEKAVFRNESATLRAGQDGRIYLTSDTFLLSARRDGSDIMAAPPGAALVNATANPDGIIAIAHAHFAKNVTLHDGEFDLLGRFSRFADAGFRSPGGVAAGPGGDFYALDQGRDRIVRFHPDGIRSGLYEIPRQRAGTAGELARFRVCEKTRTLYVVDRAPAIRCLSIDGPEWKQPCRKLWEVPCEGSLEAGCELFWGYGGFDVDENGILYVLGKTGTALQRFDPSGRPLREVELEFGELKPTPKEFIRDLQVSQGEVFVKRSHPTELFQRYDLATGGRKGVVAAPTDPAALIRPRKSAKGPPPVQAVRSEPAVPPVRGKPLRVLFIGNSQINCVRDIPDIVEELSRSAKDQTLPLVLAEEVSVGGVGLEGYWKDGLAQKRIAAGRWDWIVVNEIVYSYGSSTARFLEGARKFALEAKKAGAKVLLFATGEVESAKTRQETMYRDAVAMARECGGRVAGAGMAWQRAWSERPALDFYHTDRAHPSARGYYLNACVIFSALTDRSPEGLDPQDESVEEAIFLQRIAWAQSREDRKEEAK